MKRRGMVEGLNPKAAGAAVPFTRQGGDLRRQGLRDGLQAQRDEGLDERHRAVHTVYPGTLARPRRPTSFTLPCRWIRTTLVIERLLSVCGCGCLVQSHFIAQEPLRQFSTNDGNLP
jgi:hypothetical protein